MPEFFLWCRLDRVFFSEGIGWEACYFFNANAKNFKKEETWAIETKHEQERRNTRKKEEKSKVDISAKMRMSHMGRQ